MIGIVSRLFFLQVKENKKYLTLSDKNRIREWKLPPVRGEFKDYFDNINPRKNKKSYEDLITYVEDRPGHDFRYAIDASKINNELNWRPKETFNSGIQKTVEWYLTNQDWWKNIQTANYEQERLGLLNKKNR